MEDSYLIQTKVAIDNDVHKRVKLFAVANDLKIPDAYRKLIDDALGDVDKEKVNL